MRPCANIDPPCLARSARGTELKFQRRTRFDGLSEPPFRKVTVGTVDCTIKRRESQFAAGRKAEHRPGMLGRPEASIEELVAPEADTRRGRCERHPLFAFPRGALGATHPINRRPKEQD